MMVHLDIHLEDKFSLKDDKEQEIQRKPYDFQNKRKQGKAQP
jgi:hypothetical protein